MGRAEQQDAAVARHVSAAAMSPAESAVDIPALHRSLNDKKKVVQVLVAFARELAGEGPTNSGRQAS